jgi:hypothetical protein
MPQKRVKGFERTGVGFERVGNDRFERADVAVMEILSSIY